MGLDMYLYKKHYIGNKWREPKKQVKVRVPKDQEGVTFKASPIKNARVSEITEEVAYWRKANQIHAWFVKNVQDGKDDCGEYYVSKEKLQELLDTCQTVLKASKLVKGKVGRGWRYENQKRVPIIEDGRLIKDPSVAKELLPAQEGFFFGGTDYDDYYLQDIKDTIKALKKLVLEDDASGFYYHSSW